MSDYILLNGTLYHHGVKGQKWGLRQWQNEDGSLTPAGREHYGYGQGNSSVYSKKQSFRDAKAEYKKARANERQVMRQEMSKSFDKQSDKNLDKAFERTRNAREQYKQAKKEYRQDKAIRKAEQKAWKQQRRDYIKTKSTGERIATGLLLGPVGLYNYNSLMAAGGKSKAAAFGKAAAVTYTTGGFGNLAYSSVVANKAKEKY